MEAGETGGARMTFSALILDKQRTETIPANDQDPLVIDIPDRAVDIGFKVFGDCYAVISDSEAEFDAAGFDDEISDGNIQKLQSGDSRNFPLAGVTGIKLYVRSAGAEISEGITYAMSGGS